MTRKSYEREVQSYVGPGGSSDLNLWMTFGEAA